VLGFRESFSEEFEGKSKYFIEDEEKKALGITR
jgi:hypothetical protein